MKISEKENLAEYIVDLAKKCGADEVAVNLNEENSFNLQYRDGEIEQLHESQQCGISVQIYMQNKFSSHSTNDLRKESLKKFIENAVSSTKYLTADKYRTLPDPKFYPSNLDIDLMLIDNNYEKIKPEDKLDLIKQIHDFSRQQSDAIISVGAGYSDTIASSLKVHSNGFLGHKKATLFSMGAETTVRDKDSRPEDYYWVTSRFFNEMPSANIIGKKAAQGALEKIGQSKIKSGNYNMIVENRAAIRLVSMLLSPLSASAIQQKSSYMDGLIGTAVASDKLKICDNPFLKKGLGSKLFDGEGIASNERTIIDNGILKQYFVDNYYGKKLGLEPNGGSTSNLIIDIGSKSIDSIIQKLGCGILVNSFNGGNSNSTTGDFSFGISGFYFENGQIVKPINEMNISGNAKVFWKKLIELGNDPYPYSSVKCPSLVFEGISFSGI
jgi:PmbA protein